MFRGYNYLNMFRIIRFWSYLIIKRNHIQYIPRSDRLSAVKIRNIRPQQSYFSANRNWIARCVQFKYSCYKCPLLPRHFRRTFANTWHYRDFVPIRYL